ncbi:Fe-S cluster assembly ATPase SufC, partial [Candidatus Peregrinibacteria bacterium]|nr:Fe-S cluster assembly ATPase SufC [Candidatus Peregrinibacteria bacterium]
MKKPLLFIKDLHVAVEEKEIIRGVSLTIGEGEIHAIMGPNGSGKSTLVHALMGHPRFAVTAGTVLFEGRDLLAMSPDERARAGLFLAFQYPREIAGVPLRGFLYAAHKQQAMAHGMRKKSLLAFQDLLLKEADALRLPPAFLDRPVNVGFSGGEKKKCEILQLCILRPILALLDETDSGLDIDALRIVANGVNALRTTNYRFGPSSRPSGKPQTTNSFSALLVTHYARLLKEVVPDVVHVMVGGKI